MPKENDHDEIRLTRRDWENVTNLMEENVAETRRNHDDILVMKTKLAMAGIVGGLIGSVVSPIIIALILHFMHLQ